MGFVLTGGGVIKRLGAFIYLLVTAPEQSKAADFQHKRNKNVMPTDHWNGDVQLSPRNST